MSTRLPEWAEKATGFQTEPERAPTTETDLERRLAKIEQIQAVMVEILLSQPSFMSSSQCVALQKAIEGTA